MEDPAHEIITFARHKKKTDRVAEQKSNVTPKAAKSQTVLTPEQVHEGQAALQTPTEVVEDAIPARWRRNRGPTNAKQRQEAEQQAYIADMKALFAEVDALELAVETPTPPGKLIARQQRGGGWQTSDKPRAMSFGLSRRSAVAIPRLSILSTTSKASPSPLRISSMGPRASLHTLEEIPEFNLDGAATSSNRRRSAVSATIANPPPPRRSSVLTAGESRRSSAARMFNSLSLRISDALGKMSSRRSSVQGFREETEQGLHAVEEGEEEEEENDKKEIIATVRPRKAADIFSIEEDERTSNTSKALSVRSTASAGTILAKELDARLTLSGDEVREEVVESSPQFSELAPLEQLLRLCGQEAELESLPSMDELLGRHVDLAKVKKIGEGTFGEAFKAGNLVLKIVPMEGSLLVNGEAQKRAEEILAEVAITLTLSGLRQSNRNDTNDIVAENKANATSGFVETHGVGICRGRYASALCREWHRWNKLHKSENDSVDIFENDQLFVVFVVADGGLDLEHFEPHSFEELQSILMQARAILIELSSLLPIYVTSVTMTLAVAEEACEFEHRDLHWGNLLISRDGTESIPYRLRDVDIIVESAGVRVTLIDFTLSRLCTSEGEVAFCDLAADPELFKGPKGDAQAETYRKMQKASENDWQSYIPITNAFWMRYLADITLSNKLPTVCSDVDKLSLRNFRKAAAVANKAGDLVWHDLFAGKWTSGTSDKSKV